MKCGKCGRELGFRDVGGGTCSDCGARTPSDAASAYAVDKMASPVRGYLRLSRSVLDSRSNGTTSGSSSTSTTTSPIGLVLGCLYLIAPAAVVLAPIVFVAKTCNEVGERRARDQAVQHERELNRSVCGKSGGWVALTKQPPNWLGYSCRRQEEMGTLWSRCLARSEYSRKPGTGCPQEMRCCPKWP